MRRAYTLLCMNTWAEPKRRTNLKDHGIDFADLEGFFDGDLLTREDKREAYGEERYQSIGVFNECPVRSVDATRRRGRYDPSDFGAKGGKP